MFAVVCLADVGNSSVVFLTDEFLQACLIVVVGTIMNLSVEGENVVVAP